MSRQLHKTMSHGTRSLALLAMTWVGAAHADGTALTGSVTSVALHTDAGASLGVEQRVRSELRAVMTELIESGAFGSSAPQEIRMNVDTPAQRVSNLGLLVDSARTDRDGVHVLAITPGGAAEKMGLRTGDVLVAINGTSLANADAASTTLRTTVDALPNGGKLAFDVQRSGQAHTMSGTLASVYLPAMRLTVGDGVQVASAGGSAAAANGGSSAAQGCGRISDFDVAPRGDHLHAAKIMSIDGIAPGPTGSQSYRVDAGRHVLKVSEQIENRYLSFNDRARNSGLASDRYKTLDVDVPADTTVLIAARLNEDKRNVSRDGAYWDPVAWKQSAESCR